MVFRCISNGKNLIHFSTFVSFFRGFCVGVYANILKVILHSPWMIDPGIFVYSSTATHVHRNAAKKKKTVQLL